MTAMILQQFIYWSERRKDADKFIQEEINIAQKYGNEKTGNSASLELSYGWIYKKTEELAEELMLNLTRVTVRKHIVSLVTAGFIDERRNPKFKWDQTVQYRLNLNNICIALNKMGYNLEGYSNFVSACNCSVSNFDIGESKILRTIPEITTETPKTAPAVKPAEAGGGYKIENVGKGMDYNFNVYKKKSSGGDVPYPGMKYPTANQPELNDDFLM